MVEIPDREASDQTLLLGENYGTLAYSHEKLTICPKAKPTDPDDFIVLVSGRYLVHFAQHLLANTAVYDFLFCMNSGGVRVKNSTRLESQSDRTVCSVPIASPMHRVGARSTRVECVMLDRRPPFNTSPQHRVAERPLLG